ncbi:WAT1-related protein At4g08300 isoform X1 [Coffea arabica]|nr:WAT1-related protein At1g44800-like [Coffea arabica]
MGDQSGLCRALSEFFDKAKFYLAMVSLQFGYAGMYIICMVAFKRGMSHWVLVVYRHAVATLVMAPFAYFVERKIRPKLTLRVFLKIMALGLLEPVLDQNLYYVGMKSTSATFASAFVNVLPAVTFIMAIAFRLETVNLKKIHSLAKVIGTAITVSGAMVMTLYKGPIINILFTHGGGHHSSTNASSEQQHWVTGIITLISCIFGWSGFFILQSMTLKEYPAELSLTALVCLMGMIESGIVALIFERNMSAWVIGFDSRFLAAVYSGVVCSGIAYYMQSVVNKMRGPVFVTAFSPLSMVITAVLGAIVLAEQTHLGSLIGAIVIVIGLYSVIWGKSKDLTAANAEFEKGKASQLETFQKNISDFGDDIDVESNGVSKSAAQKFPPEP